jgi:hypothetical protein
MNVSVTKLRVKDEDFLVASMIERCPKTMMLRELLKNALEAAATAPAGQRRVEFAALPVHGATKLSIWNSGTGLSGPELYRMCDIAASIRKETGLAQNFGMGAKVASLPSNQSGMRYRSAREGRVQEVVIGKFGGIYGRLLRPGADGQLAEVIDVTPEALAEGRDARAEWTEVVLMGNAPGQDTVRDPYNGQPNSLNSWLVRTIGGRFFRFPDGIDIMLQPGAVPGMRMPHRLVSLAERLAGMPHYEAVRLPDGLVIHYAYDPPHSERPGVNASHAAGPQNADAVAALVHRDEMYGLLRDQGWRREAPNFGVPFAARHVSILVELPDDYPVQVDGYREFLRYRAGDQAQARLLDFAGLVTRHQPAWLSKLLSDASPAALYAAEVQQEMQEMLAELGVPRRRPRQQPPVPKDATVPKEALAPRAAATPPEPQPPKPLVVENAPALFLLRNQQELADRDLTYRAACYYPESHQLHINLTYPAVAETARMLVDGAPEGVDMEAVLDLAQSVAERAMVLRVARALTYGLSKRAAPQGWRDTHMRVLLSPESLSLAAEDLRTGWADTEAAMAQALERARRPDNIRA